MAPQDKQQQSTPTPIVILLVPTSQCFQGNRVTMASSTGEVPVFTDTNLGTHIAMAVTPDITAGDFKRELAKTHFSCFPKIGEIKVYGLMVKQRSSFYHLPDSVPIKYAFQNLKGTWFLHMEARPLVGLDRPSLSQFIDTKCGDHNFDGSNIDGSLITSTKKKSIMSNGKTKKGKSLNGAIRLSEELSRTRLQSNGKRKRVNNFIGCKEDENVKGCASRIDSTSGGNVDSRTTHNHSQRQKIARTDDESSSIQIDASAMYRVINPLKIFSFPSPTNSNLGSPRSKPVKAEVENVSSKPQRTSAILHVRKGCQFLSVNSRKENY